MGTGDARNEHYEPRDKRLHDRGEEGPRRLKGARNELMDEHCTESVFAWFSKLRTAFVGNAGS